MEPAALSITPIACQVPGAAWQKMCKRGSTSYCGSTANTTPDVPRTIETAPGATIPTPSAPAAWSPAVATSVDSCAGGSQSSGTSSAAQTSSDHRRRATSKSSVPDASAASIVISPVSRKRT